MKSSISMQENVRFLKSYLDAHPKLKEWAWFIGLWCFGLGSVMLLTLPFKILIKMASA